MDTEIIMQAKGVNGTIQLLPDRVRIVRDRWLAPFYDRHMRSDLPLAHIDKLELQSALGGLAGYLAIHDTQGQEGCDDLCVSFLKKHQPAFERLMLLIEQHRRQHMEVKADTELQLRPAEVPTTDTSW